MVGPGIDSDVAKNGGKGDGEGSLPLISLKGLYSFVELCYIIFMKMRSLDRSQ